jgi:hypothetical protein
MHVLPLPLDPHVPSREILAASTVKTEVAIKSNQLLDRMMPVPTTVTDRENRMKEK